MRYGNGHLGPNGQLGVNKLPAPTREVPEKLIDFKRKQASVLALATHSILISMQAHKFVMLLNMFNFKCCLTTISSLRSQLSVNSEFLEELQL